MTIIAQDQVLAAGVLSNRADRRGLERALGINLFVVARGTPGGPAAAYRLVPTSAWGVAFASGDVHSGSKGTPPGGPRDWVRAVRGGCSS